MALEVRTDEERQEAADRIAMLTAGMESASAEAVELEQRRCGPVPSAGLRALPGPVSGDAVDAQLCLGAAAWAGNELSCLAKCSTRIMCRMPWLNQGHRRTCSYLHCQEAHRCLQEGGICRQLQPSRAAGMPDICLPSAPLSAMAACQSPADHASVQSSTENPQEDIQCTR